MNDDPAADFSALPSGDLLRLAQDPAAPAERLGALFDWTDAPNSSTNLLRLRDMLMGALAGNPNTPPAALLRLAYLAPAAFCRNPAAPLLPLEVPDLVERLHHLAPPNLLRRPDLPASIASLFAAPSSPVSVREEASLHVAVAGECAPGDGWLEKARAALARRSRDPVNRDGRRQWAELGSLLGGLPEWLDGGAPAADAVPLLPCAWPGPARDAALASLVREAYTPALRALALSALGPDRRDLLDEFARVSDWLARLGVVLNPHLVTADPEDSRKLLALLADDGNRLARAGARAQQAGAYRAH